MRGLRCAIAFLTRIPVGDAAFDGRDVGRATAWFPLVGLGVGAVQWCVITALGPSAPPLVAAVLAAIATALVTGAFHLDALADMADGFGGGRDRAHVLEIMRDHVIGAYGGTALVLALALRVVATATLVEADAAAPWLLAAPALAKWSTPALGSRLPYARREGGLGAAITDHVGPPQLLGASAVTLLLALVLLGGHAFVALGIVGLVTAFMGRLCLRRIGGVTGDTLGAAAEVGELALLVLGALVVEASC